MTAPPRQGGARPVAPLVLAALASVLLTLGCTGAPLDTGTDGRSPTDAGDGAQDARTRGAMDGGAAREGGGGDGGEPGHALDAGALPAADAGSEPRRRALDVITFNWPARYGPSPGVDGPDERLWAELSGRASVVALQEAGWIAGWLRRQGWEVYRPNPPGDGDDQPVGNLLVWDPERWRRIDRGWYRLSPRTRIQEEAAGPSWHRPKYVVWARLGRRADDTEWVFASVHFVPSKHLGGAALELWKRQRDSLLVWWAEQGPRTLVMGDFNAEPGDPVCRPFWEVAQRQTAESHGRREIDWVVRKRALSAVGVEALDDLGQSDHRPVHATVR